MNVVSSESGEMMVWWALSLVRSVLSTVQLESASSDIQMSTHLNAQPAVSKTEGNNALTVQFPVITFFSCVHCIVYVIIYEQRFYLQHVTNCKRLQDVQHEIRNCCFTAWQLSFFVYHNHVNQYIDTCLLTYPEIMLVVPALFIIMLLSVFNSVTQLSCQLIVCCANWYDFVE